MTAYIPAGPCTKKAYEMDSVEVLAIRTRFADWAFQSAVLTVGIQCNEKLSP
jgi:hypothetical protein